MYGLVGKHLALFIKVGVLSLVVVDAVLNVATE
jgi:hypothetical protein